MTGTGTVAGRVRAAERNLSPAERRVAQALLDEPAAVAFGTVADLAGRAGAGVATVVRLASKLGFAGYGGLQAAVQAELTDSLRPAAERIRETGPQDVLGRTLETELENVRGTLGGADRKAFDTAVRLLSRPSGRVLVASGDSSAGVAALLAGHLAMLRKGVEVLGGSPVRVALGLAEAAGRDVLVAIDFHRYDRWLIDATRQATGIGLDVVTLTDSPLAPISQNAAAALSISGTGAGPFDSHVGTLAMANALLTGVAARLRSTATERLAAIEAAWHDAGVLTDR